MAASRITTERPFFVWFGAEKQLRAIEFVARGILVEGGDGSYCQFLQCGEVFRESRDALDQSKANYEQHAHELAAAEPLMILHNK